MDDIEVFFDTVGANSTDELVSKLTKLVTGVALVYVSFMEVQDELQAFRNRRKLKIVKE